MYQESGLRLPNSFATLSEEEMECDGGALKTWAKVLIGIGIAAVAILLGAWAAGAAGLTTFAFVSGKFVLDGISLTGTGLVTGLMMGGMVDGGIEKPDEDKMRIKLSCEY